MGHPLANESVILSGRAVTPVPGETAPLRVVDAPAAVDEDEHVVSSTVAKVLAASRVLGEQLGILDPAMAPLRRRANKAIVHLIEAVEDVEWRRAWNQAAETIFAHPIDFCDAVEHGFKKHTWAQLKGLSDLLEQLVTGLAAADEWIDAQEASVIDALLRGEAPPQLPVLQGYLREVREVLGPDAAGVILDGDFLWELAGEALEAVDEVIVELLEQLDAQSRRQLGTAVYAAAIDARALGELVGVLLSEVAVLAATDGAAAAAREAQIAESVARLRATGAVELLVDALRSAGKRVGGRLSVERFKIASRALAKLKPQELAKAQRLLGQLFAVAFEHLHHRVGPYAQLVKAKAPVNRAGFLSALMDAVRSSNRAFDALDAEAHTAALANAALESNHVIPRKLFPDFPEIRTILGHADEEAMTAINVTRAEHTSSIARHLERMGLTPEQIGAGELPSLTRAMESRILRGPAPTVTSGSKLFYYEPGKTPLRKLVLFLRDEIYAEQKIRIALETTFAEWLAKLP